LDIKPQLGIGREICHNLENPTLTPRMIFLGCSGLKASRQNILAGNFYGLRRMAAPSSKNNFRISLKD
jgi:hypothetical protein